MSSRLRLATALCLLSAFLAPPVARADNAAFRAALERYLPLLAVTERDAAGGGGGPAAVQAQYDVARDLIEALRRSLPIGPSCRSAFDAALAYAGAQVVQAEGVDRLQPTLTRKGLRQAENAARRYRAARETCGNDPPASPRPEQRLARPRSGEIVFGSALTLEGAAPRGAGWAVATVNGARPSCRAVGSTIVGGRFRQEVPAEPGRYDVTVAFCAPGTTAPQRVATARVEDVWVLPASARRAVPARKTDGILPARLAAIARGFSGISAVWFEDLRTGRTASWNADARFPAASTVKLALLVAALERFGTRSPVSYDLAAMATWSSNLATNRLLGKLGGSETGGARIAEAVLSRLGATRSTFTGGYRIGTAHAGTDGEPPRISSRVTTARDLARILHLIHAGAIGRPEALARLHLDQAEAQLALNLLLSSEPVADNAGLFRPRLGQAVPVAQKHGWLTAARHSAGIVYEPSGPKIVILLTYREGLTLADAQGYARRVLQALGL